MKTSPSLFKHIYALIIISFFIFTLSCSDDPSSPQSGDEIPLATKSIGPEGGVIEADGISIEIPSGTFDNNYEISVSSITDDNSFDGYTISNSYNIKGLPENLNKRIRLAVNYLDELNEETYLAVGSGYLDNISNEESIFYNIFQGIDSSGYFVAYLENNSSQQLSKSSFTNDDTEKVIKIINSLRTVSSEHFELTFPTILSPEITEAAANLEEAFSIVIDDLGLFNYTEQSTKISVLISKQSEGVKLNLWKLLWDPNSTPDYALNINYDLVSSKNFQSIKYNFGIQLIDLWMATKMKALQSKNWGSSSYQWLKSAFLTWAEELFSDESTFESPYNFMYNQMAPFEGLTLGAGQFWDTQNKHGHGMASLIKYLDEKYLGNQIVKKTFSAISNDIAPDLALFNNVDELFTVWFPDFFKEYLSGNIYELSDDYFYTNAHHSWSINTENDTLKDFNSTEVGNYPDLSAKLFRIDLNYSGFDETQNLLLSMKGPVTEFGLSLVVFGIQNYELTYLETAHAQNFIIPNLKEYYDAEITQFLIVLVNGLGIPPYMGESDIDLEVRVDDFEGGGGQTDLEYNLCRIDVYLQGLFEDTRWAEGTQAEYPLGVGTSHDYYDYEDTVRTITGSFVGNVFSGSFDNGEGWTQNATVTLNDEHDTVVDYRFEENHTTWPDHLTLRKVSGGNIPVSSNKNTLFEIKGVNACSSVLDIQDRTIRNETDTSKVVDHWCNENSRVVIQFYKN